MVFSSSELVSRAKEASEVMSVNLLVVLATVQVGTDLPQDFSETTVIENSQGMFKFPLLSHTRGFEYTKTTGTPTTRAKETAINANNAI